MSDVEYYISYLILYPGCYSTWMGGNRRKQKLMAAWKRNTWKGWGLADRAMSHHLFETIYSDS